MKEASACGESFLSVLVLKTAGLINGKRVEGLRKSPGLRPAASLGSHPSPAEGREAREEPTVSSSQGDGGAVDGDRHGVVLAAMEMML